ARGRRSGGWWAPASRRSSATGAATWSGWPADRAEREHRRRRRGRASGAALGVGAGAGGRSRVRAYRLAAGAVAVAARRPADHAGLGVRGVHARPAGPRGQLLLRPADPLAHLVRRLAA